MNDTESTDGTLVRDTNGRFVKGMSGNPAGKVAGTRNQIATLRENTELALRDYLSSDENRQKTMQAIDRCMNIAISGDDKQAIGAMKLLFDKLLPNAKGSEEKDAGKQRPVCIQIINQTSETAGSPITVLDGDFEEIA